MSSTNPQPIHTPTAIVGCLLDVSGSMREALETGKGDESATERLKAILRAALKLACAEKEQNPDALMFIGAFGLKRKENSVVNLCKLVDALLQGIGDSEDHRDGHDHLIALANEKNVPHISRYIRTKLTEEEARIVYMYLRRHPEMVQEFIDAIPLPKALADMEQIFSSAKSALSTSGLGEFMDFVEDRFIEYSQPVKLAHRICNEWWLDFKELETRPVSEVVPLLERIQDHPSFKKNAAGRNILDDLRPHLYGQTPMRQALSKALAVFREHRNIEQRILVMITDGESTDGSPLSLVTELQQEKVTVAGVYLTADTVITRRQLYDCSKWSWRSGQRTLFSMASKIAATQHPVPVLAAMGWDIPRSGECALYTTVCSSSALEEFCSLLLSARFGSADALLDIVGKVHFDAYINDTYMRTRNNPSNQGESETCYAHATAAVLHMALARIVGLEGGCPTIEAIREDIIQEFPSVPGGRNTEEVLAEAKSWYRPIKFCPVDENGAREAILGRRPVLATFRLSKKGWKAFKKHFTTPATQKSVLTKSAMASHSWSKDGGGHAVVLVKCDPKSLTFLNSWGHEWGDHGTFSIEDHTVLDHMRFYNVYWLESDLTVGERRAYMAKVDEEVRTRATQHPSLLEMDMQCPKCKGNAPIADFTGSIRAAKCPLCHQPFKPEPGHLVQAIYAKAGLGDIV